MTQLQTDILKRAADCFGTIRKNLLQGAALLHKISTEELYKTKYDSFEGYVEEECQIKPSFASKLISVHEYWVVQSKVSPLNLQGVDMEKLYLARKLGDPRKALIQAKTLSRSDLKAEVRESSDPCDSHVPVTFCAKCHRRL